MAAPATLPLHIYNIALSELGQEPLADITTLTNKAVRHGNAEYAFARDETLRSHPWNCATKRTTLAAVAKTITGITAANPPVVTSGTHGFTNGQYVIINSVLGMTQVNGNRYKVANVATNTFELQTTAGVNVDGTGYTAYSSGGTATVSPAWGYAYAFALPSDFIRLNYSEDMDWPFKVMGNLVLTDQTPLNIEYIYRLEDVSLMDQLLVTAIARLLAARIALPLTGSPDLKLKMEGLFQQSIAEARFADSREQQGEDLTAYSWVNARLSTGSEIGSTRAS